MNSSKFGRSLITLCIGIVTFSTFALAAANETTLFDSSGKAVAYVVDRSGTIFLFDGTPVAYMHPKSSGAAFAVYGFNGQHLGWFDKGIVRDGDGYAVGFIRGAVTNVTPRIEPLKRLKRLEPMRRMRRLEPLQPLFRNTFSRYALEDFLRLGVQ